MQSVDVDAAKADIAALAVAARSAGLSLRWLRAERDMRAAKPVNRYSGRLYREGACVLGFLHLTKKAIAGLLWDYTGVEPDARLFQS